MVWCLMYVVSYGLVSDVLSPILWFGVRCFISYHIVLCLMFCFVSYGLVSDVLSRSLWFGVLCMWYLMVW